MDRQDVIQTLAFRGKKSAEALNNPNGPNAILLHRLDHLLTRLNNDVQMTPSFKEKTKIDQGMETICKDEYHFPQEYVDKAKALLEKWQGERCGASAVVKRGSDSDGPDSGSDDRVNDSSGTRKQKKARSSNIGNHVPDHSVVPPANHPIWGEHGICHGLYRKVSINGNSTVALDRRYQQRPANVFGHNSAKVGDWYPYQLSTLFRGVHGKSQAGIYGTENAGAWSIVVSGGYVDLDEDHVNFLYYSGSRSHDNTDPKQPGESSKDTSSLHVSRLTQKPVRVLRAGQHAKRAHSEWAPTEGIRYDGLYRVTDVKYPFNKNGGVYEQFKLVRLQDQDPINKFRPTPRELRDFDDIKRPY